MLAGECPVADSWAGGRRRGFHAMPVNRWPSYPARGRSPFPDYVLGTWASTEITFYALVPKARIPTDVPHRLEKQGGWFADLQQSVLLPRHRPGGWRMHVNNGAQLRPRALAIRLLDPLTPRR